MEQVAEEGTDFQLYGVPHYCHKAAIYLSMLSTCDSRPCSKTAIEDKTVSIRLRMEQVCCGSFSMGTLVLLAHLKILVQLFMPSLRFQNKY